MQYVHSPLERRYNASDAPEGGPLFEGVDMENILLQSLMIAHKPDEWLRKDKEKGKGSTPSGRFVTLSIRPEARRLQWVMCLTKN